MTMLPRRAAKDRSRHEGWRPEKLGHRRLTAVYGGQRWWCRRSSPRTKHHRS